MRQWCLERDIELLDLALQFCLREERIHGNPIGSLNVEQLERNVQAACATISDAVIADFCAAKL